MLICYFDVSQTSPYIILGSDIFCSEISRTLLFHWISDNNMLATFLCRTVRWSWMMKKGTVVTHWMGTCFATHATSNTSSQMVFQFDANKQKNVDICCPTVVVWRTEGSQTRMEEKTMMVYNHVVMGVSEWFLCWWTSKIDRVTTWVMTFMCKCANQWSMGESRQVCTIKNIFKIYKLYKKPYSFIKTHHISVFSDLMWWVLSVFFLIFLN